MRLLPLLALFALAACGRSLTPTEIAFLDNLHGATLDTSQVRLHDGLQTNPAIYPTRARLTCAERINPPIETPTFRGAPAAMSIFQDIYVREDWYGDDMTGDYPRTLDLSQAMLLAHETLHAWQWQHRASTGYHPLRAAFEHVGSHDPYLFDPDTDADWDSFGYEQQGAIVEEYVCCRVLAPDAARTRRLHALLSQAFPVTPLSQPLAERVLLPWSGVTVEGICN